MKKKMRKSSNKLKIKQKTKIKVCRLCFQNGDNLISLKEKRKNTTILEFLKEISSSKFDNLENTSDKICSKCSEKVENLMEIVNLCKKSDQAWEITDVTNTEDLSNQKTTEDDAWETLTEQPTAKQENSKGAENSDLPLVEVKLEEDDDDFYWNDFSADSPHNNDDIEDFITTKFLNSIRKETEPEPVVITNQPIDTEKVEVKKPNLNPDGLFKCELPNCNKRFTQKISLLVHMKYHGDNVKSKKGRARYKCSFEGCGKEFSRKLVLFYHEEKHKPAGERIEREKLFKCLFPSCDKEYVMRNCLIQHGKSAHPNWEHNLKKINQDSEKDQEQSNVCVHCGKSYARPEVLKEHEQIHALIKPFSCDICGFDTTTKLFIEKHIKKHISSKVKYKRQLCSCEYCGKHFYGMYLLKIHINNWHTKQISYDCTICDKKYHRKASLRDHLLTHNKKRLENRKKYKCDYCNKTFNGASDKKKHMYSHTGNYPFICSFPGCDRKFGHKTEFTNHSQSHIPLEIRTKRFKCDSIGCNKEFVKNRSLKLHQQQHLPLEQRTFYKCEGCEKQFTSKSCLDRHKKKHCLGNGEIRIRKTKNVKRRLIIFNGNNAVEVETETEDSNDKMELEEYHIRKT